jgi:spore germination cell wall hydrolase CwlJ-like protein
MALVAVSALTVLTPGHAEALAKEGQPIVLAYNMYDDATSKIQSAMETIVTPIVNPKELACLARNIFFEAGSEPEEGKVAVGLVTLNRAQDGRFAKTICGVVDQKIIINVPKEIVVEKRTLFRTERETQTVWSKLAICQFSWRCIMVKTPKGTDERWEESQRIAQALLTIDDSYPDLRSKYGDALYFHNASVRPGWSKQKEWVGRIGGHYFYSEKVSNRN